ncbi:MAG TPA: glycosyltransferase family 39 protein [Nitrospiraceae bacterium]|nr:glycosyltransferase family 39 protein [Nitrospiraceae bacterium]
MPGTAFPSSPPNYRISIIVPTLNEAENVDVLIGDIFRATSSLGQVEIIIVDDGSTDGTRQRVMALEADPSARGAVRLLPRDGERGLAKAVVAGAEFARGEIMVVMDADLSHPPQRIPDLVKPILNGTTDMAIGSRYVPGGSTPGWPAKRRLMSRAAALLAWPITDVRDPMSGFFAVRRERLLDTGLRAEGFKIALEVLVRSGDLLRVTEVPIEFRDRTRGRSKMGWHAMVAYLRGLLSLGGRAVSLGTATRFGAVCILGMLVDLLTFWILYAPSHGLASAHLSSFLVATVFTYVLNARWTFRNEAKRGNEIEWSRYLRFSVVCLMALFLRGAVLAFLVEIVRCPPTWAVLGAVGASAAIHYLSSSFYMFASEDAPPVELRWRIPALVIVGYSVVMRLFYLGLPDLLAQEAYYWNYAQHLDLSYLDHPPMVAWMIWLGTGLFGDNAFGVRIGAFLCWLVTAFFGYRLTANMFGKSAAFGAVLLLAALPLFVVFGFFMTPDAPLIACWAGAIYFLERALVGERRRAWWGAGVCLGLGMLSKYTITLLGPATLLFLLSDRSSRHWLSRPEPYAAASVALLLFSPVLVWNADHHWASFAFQTIDRLRIQPVFSLHILIGWMMLLLTPVGFVGIVRSLLPVMNRSGVPTGEVPASRQRQFFLFLTLVPLSVFVAFSLLHQPKFNWVGPLCLAALPWLAREMTPIAMRLTPSRWGRYAWPANIVAVVLFYGAALHYLVLGFPGLHYPKVLPLVGWHDLGSQIERIENDVEAETGSEPLVVGMDKYNIASELAFYRTRAERDSRDPSVREGIQGTAGRHLFGKTSLMYGYWFPPDKQKGRTLILVSNKAGDLDGPGITSRFDRLEPVLQLVARHNDMSVARFYYRIGFGYRPQDSS